MTYVVDESPTLLVERDLIHQALNELADEDGNVELSRQLVSSLVDDLLVVANEDDHSVGICACDAGHVANELVLRLQGLKTCMRCAGDGEVWDMVVYSARVKELGGDIVRGIPLRESLGREAGMVTCQACQGRGSVAIPEPGR